MKILAGWSVTRRSTNIRNLTMAQSTGLDQKPHTTGYATSSFYTIQHTGSMDPKENSRQEKVD